MIGVTLSIVQKAMYPSSSVFFLPKSYAEDMEYFGFNVLKQPVQTLSSLIPNFLLFNIVSPIIKIFQNNGERVAFLSLNETINNGTLMQNLSFLLYFMLFCYSIYSILKRKMYKSGFFQILLIYFLFNIIFFSFYGINLPFLFSANYTYILIMIMSFGFIDEKKLFVKILLVILLILILINNIYFMNSVVDYFYYPAYKQLFY